MAALFGWKLLAAPCRAVFVAGSRRQVSFAAVINAFEVLHDVVWLVTSGRLSHANPRADLPPFQFWAMHTARKDYLAVEHMQRQARARLPDKGMPDRFFKAFGHQLEACSESPDVAVCDALTIYALEDYGTVDVRRVFAQSVREFDLDLSESSTRALLYETPPTRLYDTRPRDTPTSLRPGDACSSCTDGPSRVAAEFRAADAFLSKRLGAPVPASNLFWYLLPKSRQKLALKCLHADPQITLDQLTARIHECALRDFDAPLRHRRARACAPACAPARRLHPRFLDSRRPVTCWDSWVARIEASHPDSVPLELFALGPEPCLQDYYKRFDTFWFERIHWRERDD